MDYVQVPFYIRINVQEKISAQALTGGKYTQCFYQMVNEYLLVYTTKKHL